MKVLASLLLMFLLVGCATDIPKEWPKHWWQPVEKKEARWWEILPQNGEYGKTVVLSKRNELGLLSNFAHTPFEFEGVKYQSVEGLWQSMKFPEGDDDPRSMWGQWPYKRNEVAVMTAFEAKAAGDFGSRRMKKQHANWVTYKGKRMTYRTSEKGDHYNLIVRIMKAKLEQNPKVKEVLLKTRGLKLLADHHQKPDSPPAWLYNRIWEELRDDL